MIFIAKLAADLKSFNLYLATRLYVTGDAPTSDDATAFVIVGSAPDQFLDAARWYKHIASFSEAERRAWPPGQGSVTITPGETKPTPSKPPQPSQMATPLTDKLPSGKVPPTTQPTSGRSEEEEEEYTPAHSNQTLGGLPQTKTRNLPGRSDPLEQRDLEEAMRISVSVTTKPTPQSTKQASTIVPDGPPLHRPGPLEKEEKKFTLASQSTPSNPLASFHLRQGTSPLSQPAIPLSNCTLGQQEEATHAHSNQSQTCFLERGTTQDLEGDGYSSEQHADTSFEGHNDDSFEEDDTDSPGEDSEDSLHTNLMDINEVKQAASSCAGYTYQYLYATKLVFLGLAEKKKITKVSVEDVEDVVAIADGNTLCYQLKWCYGSYPDVVKYIATACELWEIEHQNESRPIAESQIVYTFVTTSKVKPDWNKWSPKVKQTVDKALDSVKLASAYKSKSKNRVENSSAFKNLLEDEVSRLEDLHRQGRNKAALATYVDKILRAGEYMTFYDAHLENSATFKVLTGLSKNLGDANFHKSMAQRYILEEAPWDKVKSEIEELAKEVCKKWNYESDMSEYLECLIWKHTSQKLCNTLITDVNGKYVPKPSKQAAKDRFICCEQLGKVVKEKMDTMNKGGKFDEENFKNLLKSYKIATTDPYERYMHLVDKVTEKVEEIKNSQLSAQEKTGLIQTLIAIQHGAARHHPPTSEKNEKNRKRKRNEAFLIAQNNF